MTRYTSDLTNEHYLEIQPFLPVKRITRPRIWSNHQILNGIMYLLVTGCQWRNLPNDLPPWKTVYRYFREWRQSGIIDLILKKYGKKISSNSGKRRSTDKGYY
jgi:transposase